MSAHPLILDPHPADSPVLGAALILGFIGCMAARLVLEHMDARRAKREERERVQHFDRVMARRRAAAARDLGPTGTAWGRSRSRRGR